jgi:hypothetical protein
MNDVQVPNQDDMDRLATYFSICMKLASSSFYREDTMCLVYEGRGVEEPAAKLCPAEVLSSTTMSFRKLWANDEATRFHKMSNLLMKYSPNSGAKLIVDGMVKNIKRTLSAWEASPVDGYGVTPDELIRLVINSEQAHAGFGKSRKMPTRDKLQQLKDSISPTRVDYLFESALLRTGMAIYQHGYIVPAAVSYFVSKGAPKPRLHVQSDVAQYLGIDPSNSNVSRETPGYTPSAEDRGASLKRVLKRHKYRALESIIRALYGNGGIDYSELCTNRNFVDVLKALKVDWSIHTDGTQRDEKGEYLHGGAFVGPEPRPGQVGEYSIFRDGSIEFRRDAWKILVELYSDAHYHSQIHPDTEFEKHQRELIQQHYRSWA